jgi:hypothetical protein
MNSMHTFSGGNAAFTPLTTNDNGMLDFSAAAGTFGNIIEFGSGGSLTTSTGRPMRWNAAHDQGHRRRDGDHAGVQPARLCCRSPRTLPGSPALRTRYLSHSPSTIELAMRDGQVTRAQRGLGLTARYEAAWRSLSKRWPCCCPRPSPVRGWRCRWRRMPAAC